MAQVVERSMDGSDMTGGALGEEERLRADFYGFLAGLLAHAPSAESLEKTAALEGDDTEIGRSVAALARIARSMTPHAVDREFHDLFIGLGRGELLPFASVYMTGFLNEKPLATLRTDMSRLRIKRAENVYEPEDNIASLFDMMAGLIRGEFAGPVSLDEQKRFFATHIGPWATHFFTDLETAKRSVFYAPVGALGRAFMEIEREAFRMEGEAGRPAAPK